MKQVELKQRSLLFSHMSAETNGIYWISTSQQPLVSIRLGTSGIELELGQLKLLQLLLLLRPILLTVGQLDESLPACLPQCCNRCCCCHHLRQRCLCVAAAVVAAVAVVAISFLSLRCSSTLNWVKSTNSTQKCDDNSQKRSHPLHSPFRREKQKKKKKKRKKQQRQKQSNK